MRKGLKGRSLSQKTELTRLLGEKTETNLNQDSNADKYSFQRGSNYSSKEKSEAKHSYQVQVFFKFPTTPSQLILPLPPP